MEDMRWGGREEKVTCCFWMELLPFYKVPFSSNTKDLCLFISY